MSSETLWPLASTEICIREVLNRSFQFSKTKEKKKEAEMTHAFCRKDFIWNYKHNTHTLHEKKQDFIHSYIWYTVFNHIHTCISLRQNGFSPLPSKRLKVETGGEHWVPHVAAAQKEINKENLWHRHRQTSYCYQRFTAAVQPASYAGKTESSLYHPYKPVNEGEKIWWICCIFFWLSYAHI